tara:strand:- start:68 stop:1057 length:990 start_codon:yes stop_codon:yes gene_type:complete
MIAPQGLDILFSEERIEHGRNFMNKLWNSARFILMNIDTNIDDFTLKPESHELDLTDVWILSKLNTTIKNVDDAYESYKMNDAVKIIYDFVYSDFCDWYIEFSKTRFYGTNEKSRKTALNVSVYCMRTILKLLHPYTPYITEELWTYFSNNKASMLIDESWPSVDLNDINEKSEQNLDIIKKTISSIRNLRAEMNISPAKEFDILIKSESNKIQVFKDLSPYIKRLAKLNSITVNSDISKPDQSASIVIDNIEIYIPLVGVIDIDIEIERLSKQIDAYKGRLRNVTNKLNNKNFADRAPKEIVENEQKKQNKYQAILNKIEDNLESLKK